MPVATVAVLNVGIEPTLVTLGTENAVPTVTESPVDIVSTSFETLALVTTVFFEILGIEKAVPNVGTAPALFTLPNTEVVFTATSAVLLVAPVGFV